MNSEDKQLIEIEIETKDINPISKENDQIYKKELTKTFTKISNMDSFIYLTPSKPFLLEIGPPRESRILNKGLFATSIIHHNKAMKTGSTLPKNKLATGGKEGILRVWDSHKYMLICSMGSHAMGITSIVPISKSRIAVGYGDGAVKIWLWGDRICMRNFRMELLGVHHMLYSPQFHYLACTGGGVNIKLFDLAHGRQIPPIPSSNSANTRMTKLRMSGSSGIFSSNRSGFQIHTLRDNNYGVGDKTNTNNNNTNILHTRTNLGADLLDHNSILTIENRSGNYASMEAKIWEEDEEKKGEMRCKQTYDFPSLQMMRAKVFKMERISYNSILLHFAHANKGSTTTQMGAQNEEGVDLYVCSLGADFDVKLVRLRHITNATYIIL